MPGIVYYGMIIIIIGLIIALIGFIFGGRVA
jgi:hypothetical protein